MIAWVWRAPSFLPGEGVEQCESGLAVDVLVVPREQDWIETAIRLAVLFARTPAIEDGSGENQADGQFSPRSAIGMSSRRSSRTAAVCRNPLGDEHDLRIEPTLAPGALEVWSTARFSVDLWPRSRTRHRSRRHHPQMVCRARQHGASRSSSAHSFFARGGRTLPLTLGLSWSTAGVGRMMSLRPWLNSVGQDELLGRTGHGAVRV